MQSYSPVKSHFHWGWGEMSWEAQGETRREESSPCSLWQSEQEALSKVSVHSQKAAASLQATAWWLHRRVRESRGAKGEREDEKTSRLGKCGGWVGGVGIHCSFLPFRWWVWAKCGPWWHCSSSGSRLGLCSHDNVRVSTLSPLLLTHSCQNRHSHGFSCCPWAQAVMPRRGAGCQRAVLNHWGRGTCLLWSIFPVLFCS